MQIERIERAEVAEAARWALDDTPAGASDEMELCEALELARPLLERLSQLVVSRVPWFVQLAVMTAFSALFSLVDRWRADICADLGQPSRPEEPEPDAEPGEPAADEPPAAEAPEPDATAPAQPPTPEPPES